MFQKSYRLPFSLLGIPVFVDISFLLILPILAVVIGSDLRTFVTAFHLPIDAASIDAITWRYPLGFAAAVGLFVSVLIHELGHAVVGARFGLPARRITLWLLGGLAQFDAMPRRHGQEAQIAIAGPITSALISGVLYLVFGTLPLDQGAARFFVGYLMITNLIIAVFNLIPALPLDGGRVLRSLLALRMPFVEATQTAGRIGRALAIVIGLLGFLTMNPLLLLVAFFVFVSGTAETMAATVESLLGDLRVADVMMTEVATVPESESLEALVQKMIVDHHQGYPVVDADGELVGMVTIEDIKRLGGLKVLGAQTKVRSVMTIAAMPLSPDLPAFDAFQRLSAADRPRAAVLDADGHIIGIVSKTDLLRAVEVRAVGPSVAA